jgi:hypothetical protein
MKTTHKQNLLAAALIGTPALAATVAQPADHSTALGAGPFPSWNEGPAKQSIGEFVAKVTKEGSPDFGPTADIVG